MRTWNIRPLTQGIFVYVLDMAQHRNRGVQMIIRMTRLIALWQLNMCP